MEMICKSSLQVAEQGSALAVTFANANMELHKLPSSPAVAVDAMACLTAMINTAGIDEPAALHTACRCVLRLGRALQVLGGSSVVVGGGGVGFWLSSRFV